MARELASERSSNAAQAARQTGARKPRRETRQGWFQGWFAVLLVVMLSAGAVWAFMQYSRSATTVAHTGSTQAATEHPAPPRSGIVVLRNQDGTVCQKRQIDNVSGEIYGRERVPCDPTFNAAEDKPQSQYSAGARLDGIRSAFQPKKQ